jgi:C4-dicarboxylate-binding protein DctP
MRFWQSASRRDAFGQSTLLRRSRCRHDHRSKSFRVVAEKKRVMTTTRWLCLFCALFASMPRLAVAQPIKLRLTLQVPITNHLGANLLHFKDEVERRAKNAISIEIFDDGQLYIDERVVDAVAAGEIEMGVAELSQFSYRTAVVDVIQMPFLFNFQALVRAGTSAKSELRGLIDKAILEATGVRVLWWQSYGSTVIVSKGRDATLPSRIRNQKVRVFSETMANFARECGATPLVLSSTKMHEGLKDSTLDMVMTGIMSIDTRQLWKVADTITRTEHAALEFVVIVNEKTWQSIAPRHRAIVMEAARKAEGTLREEIAGIEARAYAFAREKGMRIYELTPDQVAEWRACSSGVLDAYMNNPGDQIRQILEAYGMLRTEPCCSAGPGGSFTGR